MFAISPKPLTLNQIYEIWNERAPISLSQESIDLIVKCRSFLDDKIKRTEQPIYGINTGFGSLCKVSISEENIETLQDNLVRSHACGTGDLVDEDIVRLMLLLKIHALSLGHSGVQLMTVQRLVDMYNEGVIPVIFEQGSLGASGDLAPLAHLALPLLGEGEVWFEGKRTSTSTVFQTKDWKPIPLSSKEGLALLNGTQFMSAHGVYALFAAHRLSYWADLCGALSLDAFDGRPEPFHELIQLVRPHRGQIETAERMRDFLEGSELIERPKAHVQDPYSFRCIPQVHGASKDTIHFVKKTVLTEVNSVTDNPTIFIEEDEVISAGNFHGQPIALALDYLAIALAELGNISERRTYQLVSGLRDLPEFLVAHPGLNSGFMIPQYTAASIVSQNKQLCTPASIDSIVSSNGQEDHVSMGANGATKLIRVVHNLERILAIEWMNAAQAIEFRRPARSSELLETLVGEYRKTVPFVEDDRFLGEDIQKTLNFLGSTAIEPELLF
ncbi:histidine ammonia-lyase [Cryomorphaceae bacterium]|nr:histidine ammonia-lyase [Cryomorphaceae bacterium]